MRDTCLILVFMVPDQIHRSIPSIFPAIDPGLNPVRVSAYCRNGLTERVTVQRETI